MDGFRVTPLSAPLGVEPLTYSGGDARGVSVGYTWFPPAWSRLVQGVAVFCLTVDRGAPRYAARIFGRPGFAVLRRAEELPVVIVDVLRQLVRA